MYVYIVTYQLNLFVFIFVFIESPSHVVKHYWLNKYDCLKC